MMSQTRKARRSARPARNCGGRFSPHFELVEDWVPRSYPNRTGRERMLLVAGAAQKPVEKFQPGASLI